MMPITVFFRKLDKNGQGDGTDGVEMGQAVIPLTLFLPLIGSPDSVTQWLPVMDSVTKEVRGIINVVCRVDSNISRSERMLPRDEGFAKSSIRENVTATMARHRKLMVEEPTDVVTTLTEISQRLAAEANPDAEAVCIEVLRNPAAVDLSWRSWRKQSYAHFAAIANSTALLRIVNPNMYDVTDKAGFSPFMLAVVHGNMESAQLLKTAKVNTQRADWNGNSPLHLAAMYGHAHMVEFLIRECGNSGSCR